MPKKAFTLVELLLSAVVFALVGSLAMVTIATTVRLQQASRQSQNISLQASNISMALGAELQKNQTTNTAGQQILSSGDRVVCVNEDRLVQYTVSGGSTACPIPGQTPEYLTDTTTKVDHLSFKKITAGAAKAIQMQITLHYEPEEIRTGQKPAPPLSFSFVLPY